MTQRPWIGVILRANRAIGTGHLMRIKPLLPQLKTHAKLRLYVYAFDEALRPLCAEYNEIKTFATKDEILTYLCALPASAETNKQAEHGEYLPQVLIIDDYAIDASFEAPLSARTRLMVVDDLVNRPHDCALLLDQGLTRTAQDYQHLCNADCRYLVGARYSLTSERFYPRNYQLSEPSACPCPAHRNALSVRALLGKSTDELQGPLPPIANAAHFAPKELKPALIQAGLDLNQLGPTVPPRVFVNFGGADPVSACLKFAHALLAGQLYQHYDFTIVAGAANQDYDALQKLLTQVPANYQERVKLMRHCHDVADLLFKHDVAIGAYGGMFRERIAVGIPTIGVVIADNQAGAPAAQLGFNFGLDLSLAQLSDPNAVAPSLATLVEKAPDFTSSCLKVYDGQGLERIVSAIVELLPH